MPDSRGPQTHSLYRARATVGWGGLSQPHPRAQSRCCGHLAITQRVTSWDRGEDQHFSSGGTLGGQPSQSHGDTLADSAAVTPSPTAGAQRFHALRSMIHTWPLDRQTHNIVSAWMASQEGKKCKKYADSPFNRAKNDSRL